MPDTITFDEAGWLFRDICNPESAYVTPLITISLIPACNMGACDKKIEKMLKDKGVHARLTGVGTSIEIRPRTTDMQDAWSWSSYVANEILRNWKDLQR